MTASPTARSAAAGFSIGWPCWPAAPRRRPLCCRCCRTTTPLAEIVPESDSRIKTETVTIANINTYVAKPASGDKFPSVIVIHENRGLNPHIKDVTRRLATEGFLAVGVDMLTPLGGTPTDEDKAREMIGQVKPDDVAAQLTAVVAAVRARPNSNGKVGAVGFCWGGGAVNNLAVADPTLNAGVAYYGKQPDAAKVAGDQGAAAAALRRPRHQHQSRHPRL